MDRVPETTGTAFPKQTWGQGRRAGRADPGEGASQAQPQTRLTALPYDHIFIFLSWTETKPSRTPRATTLLPSFSPAEPWTCCCTSTRPTAPAGWRRRIAGAARAALPHPITSWRGQKTPVLLQTESLVSSFPLTMLRASRVTLDPLLHLLWRLLSPVLWAPGCRGQLLRSGEQSLL